MSFPNLVNLLFMKHRLSIIAKEKRKSQAGLSVHANPPNQLISNINIDEIELPSIDMRIKKILQIIKPYKHSANYMIFFIMYDITSNKVRNLVAKYLEKKGCTRVQRSIFLADLPAKEYETIKSDLVEVQAAYDNNDSILIIPISVGYLDAMKIIGQDINIDLITHTRNTLFF